MEDLRLLGDLHDVVVNAKAVRQSAAGIAPYNRNDLSGAFGFGIPLGGAEVTAQALYGRSGVGGRLSAGTGDADWRLGLRGAYHEPYTDTAQAVAFRAERDYTAVYAAGQLVDGLWGERRIRRHALRRPCRQRRGAHARLARRPALRFSRLAVQLDL